MTAEEQYWLVGGGESRPEHQPVPDLDIENRRDFKITANGIYLIGSRSESSGSLAFPQRVFCQVTGARDMQAIEFGPRGVLYSYSEIHVSSTRKTPYTLGYVDFEIGLRVLARVRSTEAQVLRCDMPVTLCADKDSWWVQPLHPGDIES